MDPKDKKQLPATTVTRGLATKPYAPAAGGMGAVTSVLREAQRHTGLIKGTKLLTQMNQPEGFDCPGCAWPDPPAHERTAFEFCENGAKAVMAEGTTKKLDAGGNTGFFVVKVNDITMDDIAKDDPLIEQATRQMGPLIGEEYAEQLRLAMREELGVSRNPSAIDAVRKQLIGN